MECLAEKNPKTFGKVLKSIVLGIVIISLIALNGYHMTNSEYYKNAYRTERFARELDKYDFKDIIDNIEQQICNNSVVQEFNITNRAVNIVDSETIGNKTYIINCYVDFVDNAMVNNGCVLTEMTQ